MVHPRIAVHARRQLGLVTRSQILAACTRAQLDHLVRKGALERVRTNVYRVAGAPETWLQHVLAACLTAGDGAVASHGTAARIWGAPGFETFDEIHVTTPSRRRKRIPGVVVHDSAVLSGRHVTAWQRVPVSTPARMLCDLTASIPRHRIERLVDDALRRRLTTLHRLMRVFVDLACRGRRRSTTMRAVLDERLPGFHPGESDPELKLVRWIVRAGFPRPVQQHRVRVDGHTYRLDLAYPAEKIGIEYDGWDAHRMRSDQDRWVDRDWWLGRAGWLMLHFTAKHGRATVVERVARAIAERSSRLPPTM